MSQHPKASPNPAGLRRRAEAGLKAGSKRKRSVQGTSDPNVPPQRLLHELQVHQIELEMQNTELREVRDRMEALLEKYTDLYDFAPVGYFSLDERGRILGVNLTGSVLLNVERSRLIGAPLARFIAPSSPPVFPVFLDLLFAGAEKPTCEIILLKVGARPFWAVCHGSLPISESASRKVCRLAISDISAFKEAEDARRQLEFLSRANQELKTEITQRQAAEKALRSSERHKSELLKQSHHMQEELRHLSHQILNAQEEERKRISRELHDQITQTLVGIHVHLETLIRESHLSPAKLRRKIARTQRLVETSVQIVRQFARELRPTILDDLGLIASLRTFLKEFSKQTGIRVRFSAFAAVDRLNNDRCMVLYRVAQSALTNVSRHAKASHVIVDIRRVENAVRMEVTDDGKSFDVDRVVNDRRNKRLGLLGMRERLEMVGGSLAIESVPDHGTTIRAQIPMRAGARGRKSSTQL